MFYLEGYMKIKIQYYTLKMYFKGPGILRYNGAEIILKNMTNITGN